MKKNSIEKFSFAQMTSNSVDGKTSGSGTMGVLTIGVGLLTFIAGTVHFMVSNDSTIMLQSTALISIGTALLGYRKSKGSTLTKEAVAEQEEAKPIVHVEVEEDMSGGDEEMLKS